MILYPPVDELLNKVDSKYSLVVLAAKRARQLNEGKEKQINAISQHNVGIALEEINQNIIVVPKENRR